MHCRAWTLGSLGCHFSSEQTLLYSGVSVTYTFEATALTPQLSTLKLCEATQVPELGPVGNFIIEKFKD